MPRQRPRPVTRSASRGLKLTREAPGQPTTVAWYVDPAALAADIIAAMNDPAAPAGLIMAVECVS